MEFGNARGKMIYIVPKTGRTDSSNSASTFIVAEELKCPEMAYFDSKKA